MPNPKRKHFMNQHSFNSNFHRYNQDSYRGFDIQSKHGPLIQNYLSRVHACFTKAQEDYSRVCLIRLDLHVPETCTPEALADNRLIYRFFSSLKAKIAYAQDQSMKLGNRVHHTELRYIWCRELSTQSRVHFHVALLLNAAAYSFIGKFNLSSNNMYSRVHEAWGSALHLFSEDVQGLIHIPENPCYEIIRSNDASFNEAFKRVSYLCKVHSKEFGNHYHCFGCSRV